MAKKYGNKQIEIIEANPGPCLITQNLLNKTNYNICVYESSYNVFKEFLMVSIAFCFTMREHYLYNLSVMYLQNIMYYFNYRQFIQFTATELKLTLEIFSCCGNLGIKID